MHLGKYELVRKLATGGMAEVFLAKAAGPGGFEKTLVLKRILPHLAEDPSFVEMFLGEARLVAGLNHPNVVQIFDFGEAEGSYFLTMELIDGPNLRRWQRQAATRGQPLAPGICAKVVAQAAEGLAFAHEFADPTTGQPLGLIHRDVSPDNILVSRQGAVKVVDFGIAKVAGQKHRTQTGIVKGKVAYMPPEQVRADPLDRRVDVYALGVVLYELLTGRLPFDGPSELAMMQAIVSSEPVPVSRHRKDVPSALQAIITRALHKDREDRYADCRALHADLERFVLSLGEPVGAYQIAQAVGQVVEERLVPTPAPMSSRPELRDARVETPERTVPSGPSRRQHAETPDVPAPAVFEQETEQRPRSEAGAARKKRLVPVALVGAALLVAGGGYALLGGTPPPVPQAQPGAATQAPGAPALVAAAPPTVPVDTKGTKGVEEKPDEAELEAQLAVKREQDEGTPDTDDFDLLSPVVPPASDKHVESKEPASPAVKRALGSVEFRIRPYAVVYLDKRLLGETPLAVIDVPAGVHTVTAVNPRLGKKVTRSFEVKAGVANVFKLNLLQED
ncbi:serine/threonine protein kinase [Myxococcus llanfairpwllgwyngyllgogerychwyrndrobwllllantysiliogogogochensis]|uniref:Serine/threonine protein kinase n=1 Tax=Myxococcus llanfairpwllgwyngyllgogerychwyrndrobwllllantysiliogogogochensis TaxID=2590453 RepID=A0A540X5C1_9BACT|nr:serine/threonine-protein kinase [Myxococcus llanfairpwllgwyngyllgogerychwyrndrobwllllantysiliogogogochensis]TQF16461.1 serine/threonine protein kinase [Myxococcus llanfairpwllgwyngyllgogerychwyrndrobwllllantysiliogogogochensis]